MKTWTKPEILHLLRTNDRAVERAILCLYQRQTASEQVGERTTHTNHQGFSQAHARKFSSFAKQLLRGYHLSEKQLAYARFVTNGNSRIGRYWAQLLQEANENELRRVRTHAITQQTMQAMRRPVPRQLALV